MEAFLPIFTLLALCWAITERQRRRTAQQRAEDLQHDLAHAQALSLKHQHEVTAVRAANNLLTVAVAQAREREAQRQQLHQGTGWGQLPDRPAWHRDHPTPEATAPQEPEP